MKPSVTRFADIIARVGLIAVAVVQAAKQLPDFDLPWHLALGRYAVQNRALPKIDPLAYTHRPIQNMEFLSDLSLYGIYRAGGELGLQLFGALCLVLVALLVLRRMRGSGPMAFVVLAIAIVAFGNWVIVRPATISFVLIGYVLDVLDRHRAEPTKKSNRNLLFSLVPATLLWVNAHGFAVLGVGLIVAYAAYRGMCRIARGRLGRFLPEQDGAHFGVSASVAALAFVVSGANLGGYRIYTGPLRASNDFSRIAEWQATSFSFLFEHELGVLVFGLVLLLALAFGRESDGRRMPGAWDLGLVLVALVLGKSALRLVPIAVIITAPIVARRLAWWAAPTRLLELCAGFSVPLVAPLVYLNTPTSFGVGFDPKHFPEPAVRFIEQHELRGHMWDYLDFGGYLAWRLYPRHLVLVDGRSGWVHDPDVLARFHASVRDATAFHSLEQEFGLEWAIIRAKESDRLGAPIASDPAWAMVYLDDLSAIYVKGNGENHALAEHGYRVLRHLTAPPVALNAAMTGEVSAADLEHDGRLAVEQAPSSPRAAFFDACGAIAGRDASHFRAARARLDVLAPGNHMLDVLDAAAQAVGAAR